MLAEQVDSDFASHEVIDGFSHMLQITAEFGAQLLTKLMNEELRDLFDWTEGLHAQNLGSKNGFPGSALACTEHEADYGISSAEPQRTPYERG